MPGTLTVVVAGTGLGKSQLGVSFANAGLQQEGQRGIFFDMTSRGDSQSHAEYAQRLAQWQLDPISSEPISLDDFYAAQRHVGDYLRIFEQSGRRTNRRDLDFDGWQRWHSELQAKLQTTIAFFYGNFVRGVRRSVVDGIEPIEHAADSVQLELFEYVYHQVLKKEHDWLARDLFRQRFREYEPQVNAHAYDRQQLGCMLLWTSHESMLDPLLDRALDEGDLLAGANTVIYLGKIRDGLKFGRGLYIAKHRGSRCSEEIIPYRIGEQGWILEG